MTERKIVFNSNTTNPIEEYTEVKPSKIHGLGVFAKKLIPKGTVWWHAREKDVLIINKEQFRILDLSFKSAQMESFMKILLTYSYYERDLGVLVFCLDNSTPPAPTFGNHRHHGCSFWGTVMPEVAGGAAILIDPFNIDDIANAMAKLLGDDELREELIRKGREVTKAYSWKRTAEGYLELYRAVSG